MHGLQLPTKRCLTALGLAMGILAFAPAAMGQTGGQTGPNSPGALPETEGRTAQLPPQGSVSLEQLRGSEVLGENNAAVGKVENLVLSADGAILGVVVTTGEVLGLGGNNVFVPWNRLQTLTPQPGSDEEPRLQIQANNQEIQQMPPYSREMLQPGTARTASGPDTAQPGGATGTPQSPSGQTTDAPAALGNNQQPGQQQQLAGVTPGRAVEASTVTGRAVRGPAGEKFGNITDLIISREGQMAGIVVEVGTFLGLGGRQAYIPWQEVEIAPQAEGQNEPVITISMTEEELRGLPGFDREMLKRPNSAQ